MRELIINNVSNSKHVFSRNSAKFLWSSFCIIKKSREVTYHSIRRILTNVQILHVEVQQDHEDATL